MARRFLIFFFVSLLSPLCLQAQRAESAGHEKEEYAVYSAVLRSVYDSVESRAPLQVIANPTFNERNLVTRKYLQAAMPGAPAGSDETLEDYSERNKTNRWLNRRFDVNFKYIIVDVREIKPLLHDWTPVGEWKGFKEKYPTAAGFIMLSRIGFNAPMDEALVFVSWSCGPLCGYGDFFLLGKKDDQWNIIYRGRLIIS